MAGQASCPIPYTANPLLLLLNDLILFVEITFTWPITAGLPSIVLPIFPARSGPLDELAFTGANVWAGSLHVFLIIAQIAFLLSLVPLAYLIFPAFYFLYVIVFVVGNRYFTALLNGPRRRGLFRSNPECVRGQPAHEHERWVFINGVAVGSHWLQSNLDRIAMTFRRPVYGIHNQTRGIIFDVLECIIQRDLSFATQDIRQGYRALVNILADPRVHKVVLILHSQGAIEGGLILDWLYATVAAPQLRKLEIYTFGNAANHWNAPVISTVKAAESTHEATIVTATTVTTTPSSERIIKHIEHYANEGDYVSRFGILHFRPDQARPQPPAPSAPAPLPPSSRTGSKSATATHAIKSPTTPSPKTPIERLNPQAQEQNRFFGRLFKRAGSGHQLNQHYMDNIFEMEGLDPRDLSRGRVKDGNRFMDAPVDWAVFDEWDTVQVAAGAGQGQLRNGGGASVGVRAGMGIGANGALGTQVKALSRLWAYRNGGDPDAVNGARG